LIRATRSSAKGHLTQALTQARSAGKGNLERRRGRRPPNNHPGTTRAEEAFRQLGNGKTPAGHDIPVVKGGWFFCSATGPLTQV
jgi:hypothetical protein